MATLHIAHQAAFFVVHLGSTGKQLALNAGVFCVRSRPHRKSFKDLPPLQSQWAKLCTDSLAFRDNRKSRGDCAWEVPLLFHYRWKKGHNPCSSPSTACFRKLPLLLLPRWHTGYLHNLAESLMPARLQQPWPPLGDHRKASLRGWRSQGFARKSLSEYTQTVRYMWRCNTSQRRNTSFDTTQQ